jgi:hypothetical protein
MHARTVTLPRWHRHTVDLTGYIFFGSAVTLGVNVRDLAATVAERVCAQLEAAPRPRTSPIDTPSMNRGAHSASLRPSSSPALYTADLIDHLHVPDAIRAARRFILLNFENVTGLDATAAATFKKISMTCGNLGVILVLTGIHANSWMHRLLVGNGVVSAGGNWQAEGCCPCFGSTDDALVWCEEHFLEVAQEHGILPASEALLTLSQVLHMHLDPWHSVEPTRTFLPSMPVAEVAEGMLQYFTKQNLALGEKLYCVGDAADALFVILSGEVACMVDFDALTRCAPLLVLPTLLASILLQALPAMRLPLACAACYCPAPL